MTARLRPTSRLPWIAIAILPFLVACSSGQSRSLATQASPTPSDILHDASLQLAAIPSARFTLDVQGESFIDDRQTIRLIEAKGELVRPDRVHTDFKIQVAGGLTVGMSLITIGDQHWSTDLISGKWGPAPSEFGYDPRVLFDDSAGIGVVMDRLQGATMLPGEEVHGRPCYRIQAQFDSSAISQLSGGRLEGSPVTVDLWIARDNLDLLRARLAEPASITGRKPAIWTLDLNDQGADLHVDPPS